MGLERVLSVFNFSRSLLYITNGGADALRLALNFGPGAAVHDLELIVERGQCLGAGKNLKRGKCSKMPHARSAVPHVRCTPEDSGAIILNQRNRRAIMLTVYSESASTQAVQSNGDAQKRRPVNYLGHRSQ